MLPTISKGYWIPEIISIVGGHIYKSAIVQLMMMITILFAIIMMMTIII